MRLAPVPLAFRQNIALVIHNAGESSRVTHAAPVAVAACRYFAGLLFGALEGRPKEQLLSSFFYPSADEDHWHHQPFQPRLPRLLTVRLSRRPRRRSSAAGLWCARFAPRMVQTGNPMIRSGRFTTWARCPVCMQMADLEKAKDKCPCGEALPEAPPYW
jgi:ADP-ribosylglycohydrolase